MRLLVLGICLLASGHAFIEREICYQDLGCFKTLGAFYDILSRPISLLPSSRESIRTTFRLYTRGNPLLPEVVTNDNHTDTNETHFDPSLETKVIVHGFKEEEENWMVEMKDAFLSQDNMNIITVDWSGGAGIPYIQAATNTRLVGAELALLLSKLKSDAGLDLKKVHLIGFSLGAHICGYAGERLDKVRRITGLDPAGPMFQGLLPVVTLDPTDAEFVDAIHTDGGSLLSLAFGRFDPVGHVDFYPNGGTRQPGCQGNVFETITYASIGALLKGLDTASEEVICRHRRARKLFLDTIRHKDCPPVGFPCDSWADFKDGQCHLCGENGVNCSVMGIEADQFTTDGLRRSPGNQLYLATRDHDPYCLFHWNVLVRVPAPSEEASGSLLPAIPGATETSYGTLELSMIGSNGNVARNTLNHENMRFSPGTEYGFLFLSELSLNDVTSLILNWSPASGASNYIRFQFRTRDDLPVDRVQVRAMARIQQGNISQDLSSFCSQGQSVTSDRPLQLEDHTCGLRGSI